MLNLTIPSVVGIAAGFFFLPIWEKRQQESRQSNLKKQFLDLLESLSTSLLAGKNVNQSFRDARRDLSIQYSAEADIQKELAVILNGLDNNISVESLLLDFGKRSGVDDIESFANVFDTCYRKGGNIKEVIRNTSMILEEKSRIQREIETKLAANKNEQLILSVMPVVLVALIKVSNPDFAKNFATPSGVLASTFAIGCFVAATVVSRKILDIRV